MSSFERPKVSAVTILDSQHGVGEVPLVGLDGLDHRAQEVRLPSVVCVEKCDELAASLIDAPISSCAYTGPLYRHKPHTCVELADASNNVTRVVCRTVVDHDDLEVGPCLSLDRADRLCQQRGAVPRWHDDADERPTIGSLSRQTVDRRRRRHLDATVPRQLTARHLDQLLVTSPCGRLVHQGRLQFRPSDFTVAGSQWQRRVRSERPDQPPPDNGRRRRFVSNSVGCPCVDKRMWARTKCPIRSQEPDERVCRAGGPLPVVQPHRFEEWMRTEVRPPRLAEVVGDSRALRIKSPASLRLVPLLVEGARSNDGQELAVPMHGL